jgi:hypothetical protein
VEVLAEAERRVVAQRVSEVEGGAGVGLWRQARQPVAAAECGPKEGRQDKGGARSKMRL